MTTQATSAHPVRDIIKFIVALASVACILGGIGFMIYGIVTGGFVGWLFWGLLFPGSELILIGSIFAHIAGIGPKQEAAREAAEKAGKDA